MRDDNLRRKRNKLLTGRITADIVEQYQKRLIDGDNKLNKAHSAVKETCKMSKETVKFKDFHSQMDASHKAAMYNEVVHVLGFDYGEELGVDFLSELLYDVQLRKIRQAF